MKNLTKKFSKNRYFAQVKMNQNGEVELNGIKKALERKGSTQHDAEDRLKKRISKFLGFEPKFSINY